MGFILRSHADFDAIGSIGRKTDAKPLRIAFMRAKDSRKVCDVPATARGAEDPAVVAIARAHKTM